MCLWRITVNSFLFLPLAGGGRVISLITIKRRYTVHYILEVTCSTLQRKFRFKRSWAVWLTSCWARSRLGPAWRARTWWTTLQHMWILLNADLCVPASECRGFLPGSNWQEYHSHSHLFIFYLSWDKHMRCLMSSAELVWSNTLKAKLRRSNSHRLWWINDAGWTCAVSTRLPFLLFPCFAYLFLVIKHSRSHKYKCKKNNNREFC